MAAGPSTALLRAESDKRQAAPERCDAKSLQEAGPWGVKPVAPAEDAAGIAALLAALPDEAGAKLGESEMEPMGEALLDARETISSRLAEADTHAPGARRECDEEDGSRTYEKLTGEGPDRGCASTGLQGQELRRVVSEEELELHCSRFGQELRGVVSEEELELHCSRFGEVEGVDPIGEVEGADSTGPDGPGPEIEGAFETEEDDASTGAELSIELEQDFDTEGPMSEAVRDAAESSSSNSGTELRVRRHCGLPMGSMACQGNSEASAMHGGCVAQLALLESRKEEAKCSEVWPQAGEPVTQVEDGAGTYTPEARRVVVPELQGWRSRAPEEETCTEVWPQAGEPVTQVEDGRQVST